jgi:hypothetical protein
LNSPYAPKNKGKEREGERARRRKIDLKGSPERKNKEVYQFGQGVKQKPLKQLPFLKKV